MKVGFIMKKKEYAHSTPIMEELFCKLRKRGLRVTTLMPEEHMFDLHQLCVENDLYILRPGVELALSLASMLHDQGANILNSYEACAYVQDKARVTRRLLQANIPSARSYIVGNLNHAFNELEGAPIIVKPHRGSYGEGIRILHRPNIWGENKRGGYFVQELIKTDGYDLKVYVIGDKVFALRRRFPANSFEDKLGRPVPVDSEVRKIASKVGELFNLHIFGVDFIESDSGYRVIDVNYFPGFVGVPNATSHLAEYIHNYALYNVDAVAAN